MTSVFNIFAEYQDITRNDPSFRARVRGFYRIIAGRHEDPYHEVEESMPGPRHYPREEPMPGPANHIGVYDLATLGIPWLVEAFFRGNWIPWKGLRATLRFLSHQLVGLLIIARSVISGIVTLIALPFLAIVYYLLKLFKGTD